MLLAAGGALLLVVMAMALVVWYGVDGITRRPTPDPPTTPAGFDLPFEDATFTSRDRVTLRGYWMPPRDPACAAAVVICPGRAGSLDSDLPYAVPLCAAGYGVLIFDWRAHGRSDGRTVTLGYRERDDLRAALDWLSSRGVERIGLLGLSMGAATAIGVAADDGRIAAVVADSAFAQVETVIVGGLRERYVRNPAGPPWPGSCCWASAGRPAAPCRARTRCASWAALRPGRSSSSTARVTPTCRWTACSNSTGRQARRRNCGSCRKRATARRRRCARRSTGRGRWRSSRRGCPFRVRMWRKRASEVGRIAL
ncbi:MAG: alpha/beta fold hydrolase [Anaerolineae bacterium]